MTEPIVGCVNPDDFHMVDGTHITPRQHLQWRHVATNYANGSIVTFVPNDGTNKNVAIHTVRASWTNDTPVPQYAYGLLTRAAGRVVLQAQSRGFIQTSVGQVVGVSPADPAASTVVSKFGIGFSRGVTAADQAYYGIVETRMGTRTMLLGDTSLVLPGETLKLAASLRFISEHWESLPIHNGMNETEAEFDSGESQIDLYAYPSI